MKPRTPKETSESRYLVESLTKGLAILELFTLESPTLSLADIVSSLGLNKSTAFRFLSTLEASGYLERDPLTRRYRPSLKVLRLGFRAINLEVRQVARPYLERLSQELGETVSLGVLSGTDVVYVDRVRNQAIVGVLLDIGSHLPVYSTTLGKVLLAELAPDELAAFVEKIKFEELTHKTLVKPETLLNELSVVREQGYAICDEELAVGLRAAGAAIRNNNGKAIAAINVSGSASTISLERLLSVVAPAVVRTANQISLALGYAAKSQ